MTKHIGNRIGIAATVGTGGLWNIYNQFFYQKQGSWPVYTAPPPPGLTATGGVISDYTSPPGAVYRSHIFTSSGTFTVSALSTNPSFPNSVEYLVVAGGGGGGDGGSSSHGGNGGGGGGGYVEGASLPVSISPGSYTITVGAGGVSASNPTATPGSSRNGGNSTISNPNITTLTAKGGGGGGEDAADTVGGGPTVGSGGGTWGGGGAPVPGSAGQPGTNSLYGATDYGYPGGSTPGVSPAYNGAGGGGAGGAGTDANPVSVGGPGGPGRASTIAYGPTNPVTYAGGGGGSSSPYGGSDGSGGPGGGGSGGTGDRRGTFATGGGGGGFGASSGPGTQCSGGSGIVVVRYQIAQLTATAKATGGAISYFGGKTIHTFTSSGTFASLPTWSPSTSVEYVVVAGGGGAGAGTGGGGGAGGLLTASTPFSGPFSFAVNVGAGAVGGTPASPSTLKGNQGTQSSAAFPTGTITATGGGYGGAGSFQDPTNYGGPGGSGGGGGNGGTPGLPPVAPDGTTNGGSGTAGPPRQGYDGGKGQNNPTRHGGGGGGAGGAGENGTTSLSGTGGIGVQLPTTFRNPASTVGAPGPGPSIYWVAGGGAGGAGDANTSPGGGGGGGPSAGSTSGANNALENTGGGGGGNNPAITPGYGGNGGSGIVIIAYPS